MLIALIFGIVGIAAYFGSNTAFKVLSLSNQFAVATTEAQKAMFLAAGQIMLETYKGTAFDIYYVLNAIVLFIFSCVMLRSNLFSKATAYLGFLAGILKIVPSSGSNSKGLRKVAGSQLKAASGLDVLMIGIGLLYQQAYVRQITLADGLHEALCPFNEPRQLPAGKIWLRARQAQVGQVILFILDSNDPANPPIVSGIAGQLPCGSPELRVMVQEMALYCGRWRVPRALELNRELCRLKATYSTFAVQQRAADYELST